MIVAFVALRARARRVFPRSLMAEISPNMRRVLGLATLVLLLGGCGLAGTGAAGASGAAAAADEAAQAKKLEERVRQQVQASEDAAAQQRSDAEKQGQ
jgi:hypothetical protein